MIFVSIALAASGFIARPASAASPAQESEITLLPGTVELDPLLAESLTAALAESRSLLGKAAYFAPTDLRAAEGWALVSIVGLTALDEDQSWHAEDGSWFGLILALEMEPGVWHTGVQGTESYFSMLAEVPRALLEPVPAPASGDRTPLAAAYAPLIFPWQSGTAMIYGPLGIHDGGSGWKAVDMATDGNTSLGHSPGIVVAAQSGTIDYICRDGITDTIRMGGFLYAHLLDNPGLYAGRYVVQGEQLGQLKSGNFSAACGYGYQPPNWVHLHWAFPNADLPVENWTLSMSSGLWTSGVMTAAPGNGWITARPAAEESPPVGISGSVGVAGAILSYGDGGPRTATADENGDYAFEVSQNWSGQVVPSLPQHVFTPASRAYAGTLTPQLAQDYQAYPSMRFSPVDGSTVCRNPSIVVRLTLTERTRASNGGIDLSVVTLKLDGISVLGLSTIRAPQISSQVWADIVYQPSNVLALGSHTAELAYPEVSGTVTDSRTFTAANIACSQPLPLSGDTQAEGAHASDPVLTSIASDETRLQVESPPLPIDDLSASAQPVPAPASADTQQASAAPQDESPPVSDVKFLESAIAPYYTAIVSESVSAVTPAPGIAELPPAAVAATVPAPDGLAALGLLIRPDLPSLFFIKAR